MKKIPRKNKKITIIITSVVAVALIAAVVVLQIFTPGLKWLFLSPGQVLDGELPGISEENQIKEVPKGEIRYLLNKNVIFESDSEKGNFMFENPSKCEYSIRFYIYLQIDSNEKENLLYTSPFIAPGQYLTADKLPKKLKAGEYNCTYIAKAYKNGTLQGSTDGTLTITVNS